jgi:hypothetical protein
MTETDETYRASVLEDAQDIAVVEALGGDNYVYAVKPSLGFQRGAFEQSVSNPEHGKVPAFGKHWKFDNQKGITGSNFYHALRLDKQALRPLGLWIPGLLEARTLESQGKLENGVYRDYGVAAYDGEGPNKELARVLVPQARVLGVEFPLVVPYRALDFNVEGKDFSASFVQNPRGIISGEDAERELSSLNYRGNSGVRWLGRYGGGLWLAVWGSLDGSDDDGRVDWVCGEATRAELEDAHSSLLDRKYRSSLEKEQEAFQASLR